jgi:SAM-dependent methyltransferase
MDRKRFFASLESYFERTLAEHGATPKGVDWNSAQAQELRFGQLMGVLAGDDPFSLVDYGCGYGALVPYLRRRGLDFSYQGFDVSERMVAHARGLHERAGVTFTTSDRELEPADYAVASGVFNLRMDIDDEAWTAYALQTIESLDALCERGFAFNMLTMYSDRDRMRPDLYYGDPALYFSYCKERFSRNVALLHDYDLYEFTIIVRKSDASAPAPAARG